MLTPSKPWQLHSLNSFKWRKSLIVTSPPRWSMQGMPLWPQPWAAMLTWLMGRYWQVRRRYWSPSTSHTKRSIADIGGGRHLTSSLITIWHQAQRITCESFADQATSNRARTPYYRPECNDRSDKYRLQAREGRSLQMPNLRPLPLPLSVVQRENIWVMCDP